jgi:ATP-dependent DNA helicase RecQ
VDFLEKTLQQYWGFERFRSNQKEIIESILGGSDTLALLPTGGGKSVCYQLPALISEGVCIVVSPLIALMQDQIDRLTAIGIPAVSISGSLKYYEIEKILYDCSCGLYKLLYISPERLQSRLFLDFLRQIKVSFIAIDEAHCISQWGHDFRMSYRKIGEFRAQIAKTPVLAVTATATPLVCTDIAEQLQFKKFNFFKSGFSRSNIFYRVQYSEDKINDAVKALSGGSVIVYCRNRGLTEKLARIFSERGISTVYYHAGLSNEARIENQQSWLKGTSSVMVATNAFGMGIDKPDVRTVVHFDLPDSIEAYYQELGRAGRDGLPSNGILLYNSNDVTRLFEDAIQNYPTVDFQKTIYQSLAEYYQIPIGFRPENSLEFDIVDFCNKFSFSKNAAYKAIKMLEQEGVLALNDGFDKKSSVMFLVPRHVLDDIAGNDPEKTVLFADLMRKYEGIFARSVSINEKEIAFRCRIAQDRIVDILHFMAKKGKLSYRRPTASAFSIYWNEARVDSKYLEVDISRQHFLKKSYESRINSLVSYISAADQCREQTLLNYFGESSKLPCGHCDFCISTGPRDEQNHQVAAAILKKLHAAEEISLKDLLENVAPEHRGIAIDLLREMIKKDKLFLFEENGVKILKSNT